MRLKTGSYILIIQQEQIFNFSFHLSVTPSPVHTPEQTPILRTETKDALMLFSAVILPEDLFKHARPRA